MRWPEDVQMMMEHTMDNYTHVGNDAKADIMRDKLNANRKNEEYYIIVYNECSGFEKHCFVGDQYIVVFRRGMCNMCVYRSNRRSQKSTAEIEKFQSKVDSYRDINRVYYRTTHGLQHCAGAILDYLKDARMVAIIADNQNVAIRSAGGRKWGPGWWITTGAHEEKECGAKTGYMKNVKIIAGFK